MTTPAPETIEREQNNFMVEFRGEKLPLRRVHKLTNSPIEYRAVYYRVARMGWDVERALMAA